MNAGEGLPVILGDYYLDCASGIQVRSAGFLAVFYVLRTFGPFRGTINCRVDTICAFESYRRTDFSLALKSSVVSHDAVLMAFSSLARIWENARSFIPRLHFFVFFFFFPFFLSFFFFFEVEIS